MKAGDTYTIGGKTYVVIRASQIGTNPKPVKEVVAVAKKGKGKKGGRSC